MNQLPEHRRAIYGRTFSQAWNAGQMDPIERCASRVPLADRIGGVLLCIGVGIVFALLLVHELAGSAA